MSGSNGHAERSRDDQAMLRDFIAYGRDRHAEAMAREERRADLAANDIEEVRARAEAARERAAADRAWAAADREAAAQARRLAAQDRERAANSVIS